MLSDFPAMPVLAVSDLDRARRYYEDTLGFTASREIPDGVMYRVGGTQVLVYRSSFAGTNRATAISFDVSPDAFDAEIATLRERGVTFEVYDLPGATWQDGVASMEGMRSVWFEDPDGNILNVDAAPSV